MSHIAYIEQRSQRTFQEIESSINAGADLLAACSAAGVSDVTYFRWFKKFGSGGEKSSDARELESENAHLRKQIAELKLDISFLRDCLEVMMPKSALRQD